MKHEMIMMIHFVEHFTREKPKNPYGAKIVQHQKPQDWNISSAKSCHCLWEGNQILRDPVLAGPMKIIPLDSREKPVGSAGDRMKDDEGTDVVMTCLTCPYLFIIEIPGTFEIPIVFPTHIHTGDV